jgi:hypothetical protein
MTHFYVTLPSDSSMSYFPENTVAEFTTKLSERIVLDGQYEVALAELIYPHSFDNIRNYDGSLYVDVYRYDGTRIVRYNLASSYYENESEFLEKLTKTINTTLHYDVPNFNVTFSFNSRNRTVNMDLKVDRGISFYMSEALKTKLGFCKTGPYGKGFYEGKDLLDINAGQRLIYVYCDAAGYNFVGKTRTPLLRVCNVSGKAGEMVRVTFNPPFYVPVARREFDTIAVDIRDELGQLVPFESGKSLVTLHFRRVHNLLPSS